ncbi:DHA2 family efflux MFS transporter permease subunit [Actinocorallia sp. A-T 12471]|uniref:DHA2 family efflux MFS transporter permease subunit n=1 Tax=Actinocorallia sp. A-T 12471 TaxID=3089813 RepID=UPI0029D24101|nr:DHA2 family efflux MFS transporter permease subunit [Actinocorallia sp. A-T 12471]MDX6739232.1 DHA2 family efflux MFS transporter permease subunit [Actinocorallia sp. A-T 12471]
MTSLLGRWRGNPWAILLTLSLGFFMTLLDLTIVNIAIPDMLAHLDASFDEVLWVVNGYVLILAVLLITCGRLGDLRGQRPMFVLGVAVFTIASFLCGVSQEAWQLIAARVVQGLGAAMLMPQTMALIIATFPADRRGAAMGIWGSVAGLATIAGPTVGGLLVTALDWRWIFFVNVPIGVLVLVLAFAVIPDVRHSARVPLDWTGVALASAGLFFFVFALTEGQRYDWNQWILASFAAAAVIFAVFFTQQRRRQDNGPLLPFSLLRNRNFTVLGLVGVTVSIGMIGLFLPMSIYLQSVLEYSAIKAGLVMAPSSVMSMIIAPYAGRLSDKLGGKRILIFGLVTYAIGLAWLVAVIGPHSHWTVFLAPFIVAGIGVGCVFAPMSTEAMRSVPPAEAGAAAGVNNTLRQLGSVLGNATAGAILQNRMAVALADGARNAASQVPEANRDEFVSGFAGAARAGLELGVGQHSGPAGAPPEVQRLAARVFEDAFVTAVRPTMLFPVLMVLVGAAACLLVRDVAGLGAPAPSAEKT